MARANTASLDTNFNVDPYYDDFDETKNFHRILYRPGYAVQARELTQMQSMLQNQLDRFGEHIFREGSVVTGLEVNYDDEYNFVKVRDGDNTGNTLVHAHKQPFNTTRVIHYPAYTGPIENKQMRIGEHSDYGTITLLWQINDVPGLEVQDLNGHWHPVPYAEDGVVVNIGDLLQR